MPPRPLASCGNAQGPDVSRSAFFSVQGVLMQERTQLEQRAMSAHDLGVQMGSHRGLSTLESGSNSQSWHAASEPPFGLCILSQLQLLATCGSVISAQLCCSMQGTRCTSTHDAQKQKKFLHVGPFFQRSVDVTAGQDYTRAPPHHVDCGVLLEYDLVRSATWYCPVLHCSQQRIALDNLQSTAAGVQAM